MTGLDIEIRLARPGDEPAIHQTHMRSIREVCSKDHGEEEIRGWGYCDLGARWIDEIHRNEVWVAEINDEIHGLGCLKLPQPNKRTNAYLYALYLTPEIIGKKVGSRMMEMMIQKAKTSGASGIDLDSTITAYRFYQSFGFKDAGPMRRIQIGGYPVTSFPMRLEF